MRLWKVTIDGVGQRYVMAKGRKAAHTAMVEEILKALPVHVEAGEAHIEEKWKKASRQGESSQRRLLAQLDHLNDHYADSRAYSRARLKAERDLQHIKDMESHIDRLVEDAGPLSPKSISVIQAVVRKHLEDQSQAWR